MHPDQRGADIELMADAPAPGDVPRRRPGRPRHTEPSSAYVNRLNEIIETGIRVFHERGYDAGTLDDVASMLGLRRASLYHYLNGKGELLYLIFDRAITTALGRLDEISAIGAPREQLIAFVAHQIRMVGNDPSLFAVAFDQRCRIEDEFNERIRLKERAYLYGVTAMVERSSASGALRGVDCRQAAHALIGMTTWLYKWFDPTRDDLDDVTRTMVRLILGDEADLDDVLVGSTSQDCTP